MTLPFRNRHHDLDSTHDRARALISTELNEPLEEADSIWLAGHLEACAECRRDRDAFTADRALLRGLRETAPEPPRDLWARTAAAIEKESRARRGPAGARTRTRRWAIGGGAPMGVAAAALVVLVVVASAIIPRVIPTVVPPAPSDVAQAPSLVPPPPQPTPLALTAAGDVGFVRRDGDGRWQLVISEVDEVCPTSRSGCDSLGEGTPQTVDLGGTPTRVVMSPRREQLVVQSDGSAAQPGKVFVVPLATAAPGGSDAPSAPPTVAPAESPGASLAASPVIDPSASPGTTPPGAIEIASGVTMVGEAAYSEDGAWLAFSARPADRSTGPDLYVWHVGDAAPASPVSDDHATYFSSWLGNRVVASQVLTSATAPEAGAGASAEPGTPEATLEAGAEVTGSPAASPDGSVAPASFHAISFLLDPATGARTDLSQPDVWLPVVDAGRHVTAYWSGTLVRTADGLDWQLGEGQLVLDRWVEPGTAPSPTEPEADPSANASSPPVQVVGPAGTAVPLAIDHVRVFKALFDPKGTRLAVWAADDPAAEVGRLHLLVIDPQAGTIDAGLTPLSGAPALRRFSVDTGRLAWVSPRGQDGQESAVKVLGWEGRNFGEINTIPARDLFIVR